MAKKQRSSEMAFLDHLEELRWRILWSLLALVIGLFDGFGIFRPDTFWLDDAATQSVEK